MNDEKKTENNFSRLKGYQKAMPITFAALAIFSALCVFSHGSGLLGDVIGPALRGLFSIGGYFLPFLLGIHALCYASDIVNNRFVARVFFTLTAIVLSSTIEYAAIFWGSEAVFAPMEFYASATAGGLIGSFIGFCLMKLIGHVGVIIFAATILAIYAIFFYADRTGEFGQKALKIGGAIFGFLAKTEGDVKQKIADKKNEKAERKEEEYRNKSDDLLNDSFFTNSGVENLKIDELGIGKDVVTQEPIPAEPVITRRRRNSQKPVDAEYETEIETEAGTPEIPDEKQEAPDTANETSDLFGIEDSAEKVFTQNFDPFDFATGEKVASKPSSKANFEVEIDELTMLELKGEPTEREKRMMELEKRKKQWFDRKNASNGQNSAPIKESSSTATESPVVPAAPIAPATPTEAAPTQLFTPAQSTAPSFIPSSPVPGIDNETSLQNKKDDAQSSVGAYTSYTTTQTTYTQPVKTVEFTINGNTAPTHTEPTVSTEFSKSYEKSDSAKDSTEDVAAFIAEKIARANPAYARSANEMKTFMKITPSPNDAPMQSADIDNVSFIDKLLEEQKQELSTSASIESFVTEEGEPVSYAQTEVPVIEDSEAVPTAHTETLVVEESTSIISAHTETPVVEEHEPIISIPTETPIVEEREPIISAHTEALAIEEREPIISAPTEAPVVEEREPIISVPTEAPVVEDHEPILSASTETLVIEESRSEEAAEARDTAEGDDSFFPLQITDESDTQEDEDPRAEEATAILDLASQSTDGIASSSRASYERAASFIAGMSTAIPEVREDVVPEFKPYEPLATENAIAVAPSFPPKAETITVERSMLSPSVASVTEPSFAPSAQDDTQVTHAHTPTHEKAQEETEVLEAKSEEDEPLYVVVDEDSTYLEKKDDVSPSASESLYWKSDDELREDDNEVTPNDSIDFLDESEDEAETDGESEVSVPSFDEVPEEDDAPIEEIPPEEQNPDVIKMREMFPFLAPIGENPAPKAEAPVSEPVCEPAIESKPIDIPEEAPKEDEPPFDGAVLKESAPPAALVPVEEEKKPKKPDYSDYEFPPIELLAKEEAFTDENIQAEIQENADKLIETLASFGVTASIKGVDRGPRITRYEVVPAKGVKVSSILNLQDDIALNLAAGSIRMEAPIPGKSAVGIEIPNKKSSIVRLRDLLETEEFISGKSKTAVCIGRDVAGQPVFGDISKMPHLLIAGATGMGKSVCINSLMISMLYKARPDEVKFIMIDPKQVEFTMYNGIPHLLVPVVSDAKQAAGALMWAVEEMERRYNLLNPLCVRNVEAYNEKVTADPSLGEPMSKIVIVIDEFADLMLQVKDPVENLVMRIAQKARAAGIHLIIGTQRPSVNVITGVIKANVPSRISCKVMSNVDSKTVLDSAGAEKLLDRGDALYAPAGSPKPHRVQCAFVADGEVEAIMAHLKKFSDGSNYDSNVMDEIERAAQKCSKKGGGSSADHDDGDDDIHGEGYLNDRQFLDAVEVAVNTRKISTSLIQRKLSIGYGKAAKFIDIMEDMGIVGEANGQRPREVLISPDEWREKLARATLD